jgi:hypothetical protein
MTAAVGLERADRERHRRLATDRRREGARKEALEASKQAGRQSRRASEAVSGVPWASETWFGANTRRAPLWPAVVVREAGPGEEVGIASQI